MNKELALRTFAYLNGHYKTHEETIINSQEIEAINYILDKNERLEQQCKKQKEYNQHLHNLNNTIFRELLDKKYENKKQKEVIDKAIEYISNKKAIINTDVIRIFDLFEIDEQGYTNKLLDILKEVE